MAIKLKKIQIIANFKMLLKNLDINIFRTTIIISRKHPVIQSQAKKISLVHKNQYLE